MQRRQLSWSWSALLGALAACTTSVLPPVPPTPAPEAVTAPAASPATTVETALVAAVRPRRFPRGPTRWLGIYTCGQGLTRLELTITRDPQTNDLAATFAFFAHPQNPGVPSGRFTVKGSYDGETGQVRLHPEAWLQQPTHYRMVGLDGTLSANASAVAGNVVVEVDGTRPCTTFALTQAQPGDPWPPDAAPPPIPQSDPVLPPVVPTNDLLARIDGRELHAHELESHAESTGLGRGEAFEDLIDLVLVEQAARSRALAVPSSPWSAAARSSVELKLADALGIGSMSQLDDLIVDHAWVKDTQAKGAQEQQRRGIVKLRELLLAGRGMNEAWNSLGIAGKDWHVAEQEEYAAPVLPDGAQHLMAGSVSEVLAGDGGLHLFKVHGRRASPEAAQARRRAAIAKLRAAAQIERLGNPE